MHPRTRRARTRAPGEALWYKDAIVYELHVRSFQDSNGDGIGDFAGLRERLPYLQDLGVTAVWLLPFYPSPLRDDGYDIADYTGVHPDYGSIDDFCRFLERAHGLGLRVITELVVNHTSDQHAWFRRAREAPPGSVERDFYVWSESPDRYGDARIIFPDFERSNWSWDPVARAYYWHRFYSHQPDLNYDNPAVFDAVVGVLDYWFRLGVDGMRLDAVPYLIEREGTHSENLGATHGIVKRLRAHVDRTYSNRIFIAEANQWPEDAAEYFGDGDESHMVFHFPLMPRLFMALRQEERLPILDILAQTPQAPPGCQWALFLRNHDELTLEMVSEEERLYMYHVYAGEAHARINLGIRRRLAPLLGNHRRRIELMNALLFSLQGTPVLYYGDEIGMGDNIYLGDRNGVRTPMQWNGERNAGFSAANPQRLFLPLIIDDEYHHQSVHVAQQSRNPHSLLWWMKRLIAARRRYQAFGRGDLEIVDSPNSRILAFVRRWRDQRILVVANLSRFVQHAELDLAGYRGAIPIEIFGRVPLPALGAAPYALTLAPHGFLWLELTSPAARGAAVPFPRLEVEDSWEELLSARGRADLESILPAYVERSSVWNVGARTVLSVGIEHATPLGAGADRRWLTMLRVTFTSGEPERYLLPLGCRPVRRGRTADAIAHVVLRRRRARRDELFDAAEDPRLAQAFLDLPSSGRPGAGRPDIEALAPGAGAPDVPRVDAGRGAASQPLQRTRRGANALVSVAGRHVLKLFRVLEPGPNPEIEMHRHLREAGFRGSPALLATYRWTIPRDPAEHAWVGLLQDLVPNEGEAWVHAVSAARRFLERTARRRPPALTSIVPTPLWHDAPDEPLDAAIGSYLRDVERLGARVADLHRALAHPTGDPAFTIERSTPFSRRSTYQRMRRLAVTVAEALRGSAPLVDRAFRRDADDVIRRRDDALAVFHRLLGRPITAPRIRCHGNLHLGQVLYTAGEMVIVDFDGEPGRPVYERRLKQSPLQDVATMVRSFHYAAHAAARTAGAASRGRPGRPEGGRVRPPSQTMRWMRAWQRRVSTVFVDSYLRQIESANLLPAGREDAQVLFHAALVERAFYELGFELNRRSDWIGAPLLDLPLLLEPPGPP